MSIFARRFLQRCIDSLQDTLTEPQLKGLVHKLNLGKPQSLAAEWELLIIHALLKSGQVTYEGELGGRSRPDLHFHDPAGSSEFVADITCVSDRGLEDKNPVQEFMHMVHGHACRMGIRGGLDFRVGHDRLGKHSRAKVRLRLPRRAALADFIEKHVLPELRTIVSNPTAPRVIVIRDGQQDIQITYAPGARFSGAGYVAYRHATVIDSNPLHNRLDEKALQLAKSGFAGPKGIIVCDGGCETLTRVSDSWEIVSKRKILEHFFKRHPAISFVVLIWVRDVFSLIPSQRRRDVTEEFAGNPWASAPLPVSLAAILRDMPANWAPPTQTGENARIELERPPLSYDPFRAHSHWGGSAMTSRTIKLSTRGILEVLAGRRSAEEFEEAHGFTGKSPPRPNFFERALREGCTIKQVTVDPAADDDDDWIEFIVDGPDPAISPFRTPNSSDPIPESSG